MLGEAGHSQTLSQCSNQLEKAHLEDDSNLRGQAPDHLLFCVNQAKAQPCCLDSLTGKPVSEKWT